MNKKYVLYTIIILLLIFLPLTVFSYSLKDKEYSEDENPKHFPYFDGYLWFYNNSELINKYRCENERCTYAYPIINEKYVFIIDGNVIKLYDIYNKSIYNTYDEVKKEENIYLVKKNNLWGIYKIDDEIKEISSIENEIIKKINNRYALKNNNKWSLIDENNILISNLNDEIIDYNNSHIICKNNNIIKVYDFDGNLYLDNFVITDYAISENYLALVIDNNLYIYKDLNNNYLKNYYLNSNDSLTIDEINNSLNIKQGNILLDTIAIS